MYYQIEPVLRMVFRESAFNFSKFFGDSFNPRNVQHKMERMFDPS